MSEAELARASASASEGLGELARLLGVSAANTRLAAVLPPPAPGGAGLEQTLPPLGLVAPAAPDGSPVPAEGPPDPEARESPESVLAAGIQDVSQALIDDSMRPAELLAAVAETVYRALGARRVLICLREGAGQMRARHGLGLDIREAMAAMQFSLGGKDLFNLILAREVDVLIRDASADKVRQHLPDWYRQQFDAASFIVLPMRHQQQPLAMIYAESAEIDGIRPGPETLNLLRSLRNQALLVLKLRR